MCQRTKINMTYNPITHTTAQSMYCCPKRGSGHVMLKSGGKQSRFTPYRPAVAKPQPTRRMKLASTVLVAPPAALGDSSAQHLLALQLSPARTGAAAAPLTPGCASCRESQSGSALQEREASGGVVTGFPLPLRKEHVMG